MDSSFVCAARVAAASSRPEERTDESASPSEPVLASQRFRPADRILRSSEFERIYKDGQRLTGASFAVFTLPNELGRSRLGLTVTRKFGNAVQRNRHKRIVREIFRKNRSAFGNTRDYVVNIRFAASGRAYTALERELLKTVKSLQSRVGP